MDYSDMKAKQVSKKKVYSYQKEQPKKKTYSYQKSNLERKNIATKKTLDAHLVQ